jgi:cell division protein FtsQ
MPLRGSVTQSATSVRMRAKETHRFGFLIRLGILAGGLVALIGIVLFSWHEGWPQRQAQRLEDASLGLTAKAQFSVKDIIIEGRQHVNKDDLSLVLETGSGSPILKFDPAAAEERIEKLPWVASATVERRLPDTIIVRLTERVPMARWQHDDKTIVIDMDGNELPEASLDKFAQLPLVVGADAAGQAHTLLETLKDFPAVTQHMTAAVRVGERRWDIHLQPKTVARLPEQNITHALSLLSDLIVDRKILDRDIVSIDLRDPSKMFLEPGSPATATGTGHAAGDTRL